MNCNSIIINPDPGTDYDLGAVFAPGAIPSDLQITVNNAASATVNNITVRNLSIDQNYRIKLNIAYQAAGTPVTATFTIKVRDSLGQESSESLTVKKSAIVDNLAPSLPNGAVGAAYSAQLSDGNILVTCSPATISITGGALPTGTNLEFSNFGVPRISGTPLSGGLYRFEVTKSYANGENLKRNYSIFVNSNLADLPAGATSWWRAEDEAVDFYNLHNGAKVGSVSYDVGKVNQAFKFNGTNGYIQLPDDTFSPSLDFTFETWFKTATSGVILGQQRAVTPYNNPQYGSTPAIYVDQNGKLRVQMFASGDGLFVTSQNRVDDNGFHHVAVSYDRTSQTRTVYLDGVNIGSQNSGQSAASNYKYQFGTGYVNDGFVGGLTGWINFNGLIDEPTLYNRVLSQSEISSIFTAGDAGKISVSIFTTPAQTRDASTGSITVTARGGTPALNYSIDGGTTFKNTSSFIDLAPGTYTVVVKDGANRTITRQSTVVNPPPTLSLTTSTVSPTCNGAQNGVIRIFPTGGSGNYEYSVRNGANVQSSNIFDSLNGGAYTPWIRDLDSNTIFTGAAVNLSQPSAFTVSPTNFVNATLNQPYSRTFAVSGGTPPFNITADGASNANGFALPAGLTATADSNSITISGTPQQVGTFPILLFIQDQNTCQETRNFPLTITSTATYGISGRVTNGGQGLANVTLTLAGAENRTTVSDASGNYSFATVAGSGNYTVTATLANAAFAQPIITYNNLSANFTDANFATAATTYEGDIATRPTGDGAVNVLDLVTLGRINNNLDAQPANGAEYQRADIAPRSSLGNGVIDVNDFNQLRDYIVANNPRTVAGGAVMSASPLNQPDAAESALRQSPPTDSAVNQTGESKTESALLDPARITAATVGLSNKIFVPITLNSGGNVSAIQFTINYDSTKLNLSTVQTGTNLPPNTVTIVNANTPGRINMLMYLPQDGTAVFPTGSVQILRPLFTIKPNSTGFAAVGFGDVPTQSIASDPQANAVTLNNTPGGVSITTVYQISGRATNGGQGLSNVSVYLRTGLSDIASTTTDAAGNYSFGDITPGNSHSVRVQLNGYSFTPATLVYNNINANFTDANFATTATTYEGDIATRPTGDNAVNVLDLVALGRIIANLDAQPASGGEWQRTDVAPLVNLGDGFVNVQDLVQLGRYAGNLDALRPAGGAIFSAQPRPATAEESLSDVDNPPPAKDTFGIFQTDNLLKTLTASALGTATVSASSVTATSTNAVVPVNLNSMGDTAAIQFTVNYDPAKLSIPNDAAIVNRYPNTTFIINRNAAGKLGIVAYQPLDGATVFPIGDRKLFDINFTVNSGASGTTTINFGNDPVTQTAANPQAGVVQVANNPGTVTLLSPTAAGVSVGERVFVGSRGLMNAIVNLTDQSGAIRTTRTTTFGYFHFEDVPAGQTYVVTVVSKRYQFAPQVISVSDDLSDLNFAALE